MSDSMRRERSDILRDIQSQVGGHIDDGKVTTTMVFCFLDGDRISAEFWQPEGYVHGDHTSDRAFIFTPTTRFDFRKDGELRHYSVGTVLWREFQGRRRYCLFRRTTHPVGYYTLPAGHLEVGEDPCVAALREAYEETKLGVLSVEPLYEGEILDECRRGANYHHWYTYLCSAIGEPHLSDEGDIIGWFSREEIRDKLPLTRPTGFIFGHLFGEQPRHVRER